MHRDYDRRAYASLAELQSYEKLTASINSSALARISDEMNLEGVAATRFDDRVALDSVDLLG